MADKPHVHIRISYHGGMWRYHRCSVGFWERLQVYLDKRRKTFDCIAELSPYKCECPPDAVVELRKVIGKHFI